MALVYKIIAETAWKEAVAQGIFRGAAIDISDGFIHLSGATQAEETARRHFAGQDGLILVAFDATHLADLRWEPSRGGELFPHVYGALDPSRALWAKPLPWTGQSHSFPAGWRQ